MTSPESPWVDGPFPERLGAAISLRRLGLQRLSAHLRRRGISCSASTLSLWRAGHTRPRRLEGKRAIQALEEILGTPPGYLVDAEHISVVGSTEWWSTSTDPEEVLVHGAKYAEALNDFGLDTLDQFKRLHIMETHRLGADRHWEGCTTVLILEALQDGVDRFVTSTYSMLFTPETPYLRISEPQSGARLGRRRVSRSTGLVTSELILDAPLRRGEGTMLEIEVIPVDGPEPPISINPSHTLRSTHPVGQMTLILDAHPDQHPVRVTEEVQRSPTPIPSSTPGKTREISMGDGRAVATARNLAGGTGLTIEWTWPEDS